jgi:hypothetical protein
LLQVVLMPKPEGKPSAETEENFPIHSDDELVVAKFQF